MFERFMVVEEKTYQRDELFAMYDELMETFGATEEGRALIRNEDIFLEACRLRESGVSRIGCDAACVGSGPFVDGIATLQMNEDGTYRMDYLLQLPEAEMVRLLVENEQRIQKGVMFSLVNRWLMMEASLKTNMRKIERLEESNGILSEAIQLLSRRNT
ncbi:MAG: hypothetical protein LUD18_07990 [Lachnospiraceae bacterium]|nr:hypothetical protein [Lachnospiraceae bacterium]